MLRSLILAALTFTALSSRAEVQPVYHMARRADWAQALQLGAYDLPSRQTEGFLHCSTLEQLIRVANTFRKGEPDLLLLEISPERLTSPLKYELVESWGWEFPHVFGPINVEAVTAIYEFPPDANGEFHLPDALVPAPTPAP